MWLAVDEVAIRSFDTSTVAGNRALSFDAMLPQEHAVPLHQSK